MVAAGYKMKHTGGLLVTVRDQDKAEVVDTARKFAELGFSLFATPGTAKALLAHGLYAATVRHDMMEKMLEMDRVQYVISTSSHGRQPQLEDVRMRRKAVERGIPLFTSMDTANALANALTSRYTLSNVETVDINNMRTEREKLHFVKMRGTGNDYLYFDCFEQQVESPESLAVRLSNRRTGVGSDGIVLIMPSETCDAKMRVFGSDGSESFTAGNTIRCVGKYLYETGRVRKERMTIEIGGVGKDLQLYLWDSTVFSVQVDMGKPEFAPARVPVLLDGSRVIDRDVFLAGENRRITCLSMGNPHAIETDPMFPERVTASFATMLERNIIKMRVWERGIGETAACGTGACAAEVAAVEMWLCDRDTDISVRLPGGELVVRYETSGLVWLPGDAKRDFEGTVEI